MITIALIDYEQDIREGVAAYIKNINFRRTVFRMAMTF